MDLMLACLLLLTVVQATAQAVCVFAQTHKKLEGTLLVSTNDMLLLFLILR